MRGNDFEVDRTNGKVLGVCAGIANRIGVDPIFVRVGFVLAALLVSVQWTLVGYGVLFLVGKAGGYSGRTLSRSRSRTRPHSASPEESRERLRSLDLRMQAIETHAASSNSSLAREIESLRQQ